jgi:hypothetical protein
MNTRRTFLGTVAAALTGLLGSFGLRREAMAVPAKLPDPDTKVIVERVPWKDRYKKVHELFSQTRFNGRQMWLYDEPARHPADPELVAAEVVIAGEGWDGKTYEWAVVTTTYRRPAWELN